MIDKEQLNFSENPEIKHPDFLMQVEPGLEQYLAEFNIQIANNGILYNNGENGSTSWNPDRLKMVYLKRDRTTVVPTLIVEITPKEGGTFVKKMPLSHPYDEPVIRDEEGFIQ